MNPFTLLGFELSGSIQLALVFIAIISVVANILLFVKADLPWWSVFVPFYNIMTGMKLIGRPTWHAFLFFTPAVIYLFPKTILEIAQSFGKHTLSDYILALVFNVFYILSLGLSPEEEYVGPAYKRLTLNTNNALSATEDMNLA
ncbi:MAG: hypothetical protein CL831_05615 [Crocinitomicaceae bacterium]|nr:hypothetical protein [Crocinitomicaceae bacterium]|tara:strand:+ start:150 stop:581 length:432 start_codon:yes stop_codon:yes gene_type:complete